MSNGLEVLHAITDKVLAYRPIRKNTKPKRRKYSLRKKPKANGKGAA